MKNVIFHIYSLRYHTDTSKSQTRESLDTVKCTQNNSVYIYIGKEYFTVKSYNQL